VTVSDVVHYDAAPGEILTTHIASEVPIEMDEHMLAQYLQRGEKHVAFGQWALPLHRRSRQSFAFVETGIVAEVRRMAHENLVTQIALQFVISLCVHVIQYRGFGFASYAGDIPVGDPISRLSICQRCG
jgi:hypothetical protein